MGSYPSSGRRKIISSQVHLSCESLSALDRCLTLTLNHVSREQAVKSIFLNTIGSKTLVEYLSNEILRDVQTILKVEGSEPLSSSDNYMILQNSLESCLSGSDDVNLHQAAEDLVIFKIICGALPRYLGSEIFHAWRSKETLESIKYLIKEDVPETTLPELPVSLDEDNYDTAEAYVMNKNFPNHVNPIMKNNLDQFQILQTESNLGPIIACEIDGSVKLITTKTIIEKAMDHCDPIEASKLLRSRSWLPVFLAMAETLPIGISLSSVQSDYNKFPVVYMNNFLEKLIKLKRKHCFEKNFDFPQLVTGINVTDIPMKLTESIQSVISVLNQNSSGEYSNTVVGIKPIFDDHYRYCYVIGFHLGLRNVSIHIKEQSLLFMEKLLIMLPEPEYFHDIESNTTLQSLIN
eukprot:gene11582-24223_t